MNGKPARQSDEPDWARLSETELRLDAEIATAREDGRRRVAAARAEAAAATADPATMAALAAEQERADVERHAHDLARLADDADMRVRSLALAPESLVESLAQWALDAALADAAPIGPA